MKKIIFYIHSLNKGGAERVLLTIADYLKEEYEIVILTDVEDQMEYTLSNDIRRIIIGECSGRFGLSSLKRLQLIRRYCRQEQADICIAFMISGAMRGILANLCSHMPVIAAVRSNPFYDYPSAFQRHKLNLIFSLAAGVVCQTDYQKKYFSKTVQNKTTIISNPISPEFRGMIYEGERDKRIVTVGRLFDYKNQKLFIRVFSQIASDYPEYMAQIYGDGPYREELQREINSLNMQDRVSLVGDSSHVAEDIRKAEIFILPSDTEGMPNALMEAMALGMPVIATNCPCGGPQSLIKDGENGFLCPVGDQDTLAQKMVQLLEDRQLRIAMGHHAATISETCSINMIGTKWQQFCSRCCERS